MNNNETFKRKETKHYIHYDAKRKTENLGEVSAEITIWPVNESRGDGIHLYDRGKIRVSVGSFPGSEKYQPKYNNRITVCAFLTEEAFKGESNLFEPFLNEVRGLVNTVLEEEEVREALNSAAGSGDDF